MLVTFTCYVRISYLLFYHDIAHQAAVMLDNDTGSGLDGLQCIQ
jgi:hypothetical protein